MPTRILDIDALLASPGSIRYRGQEHSVRPIDGVVFQAYRAAAENGGGDVLAMYRIAARLVPSLSEADVMGMTPAAVSQIVELALEPVMLAESQAGPNGSTPGATPMATLPAG